MIRAVLDTNVLVSALIAPAGKPAQIVRQFERFEPVTSEEILTELERVLHYPRLQRRYKLAEETVEAYVELLRAAHTVVEVLSSVTIVHDDPDDDKFIACALEGEASHIVSGDLHLRSIGQYQSIQIVTPAQFLEMLGGL